MPTVRAGAHAALTPTQRWERVSEWPLMAAAVAFLLAYAVPIIRPDISPEASRAFEVTAWVTWALFVLDYLARLRLADDRRRFFVRHLLDLLIIALPLLRPLRLLRLVSLLKVLNRQASSGLRGRVGLYVAGGSALLALCGTLAVLDAERSNPDANIVSFGDATWWAVTTMTTVGYGDRYPTTGIGRLAAAALMVGGIALLGVVTATFASWLIEQVAATTEEETSDLRAEVVALHAKLDQLLAQSEGATHEAGSRRSSVGVSPSQLRPPQRA